MPAERVDESTLYKLLDQPLSQVVLKMYDPSNVFDDVSHDENRNIQVQVAGAQIQKYIKVILHQSTSPPPGSIVCKTPPTEIPLSLVSPVMEWRSPLVPSDCGTFKARNSIDKGLNGPRRRRWSPRDSH